MWCRRDMEDDKLPPIAIVGMSFRFPGEANTSSGFWDVLSNARSTRSKIPKERFDPDQYYHPSPDRHGAIVTTEACFMQEDPGLFDAQFFSITAPEAEGMDPQHRQLLEITYEAFENAGIRIQDIAGSHTACYVGGMNGDYELMVGGEINQQPRYQATGTGRSLMANRISWFYDLRGPSFVIDTACSSSMIALHEACRELYHGSSKMAVVGGTNLMLRPEFFRGLTAQRFLSPDGTSHSFDARANGYGRGEGTGILILKPLADAIRDNDVVRAVIRGSGINQDGKTPAITVPSVEAQMSLIKSTYENAGLDLSQTTVLEAHGTGTPVGDPLELLGIGQTIGASRREMGEPVLIGSVKSNIGHLESASGIAAVIKTVFALEHGSVPAVAEFETPNPRLKLDDWNLKIPIELTPWPTDGLRRASINSFGYGGSNAHVILDDAYNYLAERNLMGNHNTVEAPMPGTPHSESTDSGISIPPPTPKIEASLPRNRIYVFSSPDQDGLARLASKYAAYLGDDVSLPSKEDSLLRLDDLPSNLAYTLSQRRSIFDWRSFVVADSLEGLRTSLEGGLTKLARSAKNPSCAFVFTGQGAQWFAMGRELNSHAVFRESLQAANAHIAALGSAWSVIEELGRDKESSRISEPQLSQPLCTALQVALVDLLTHWGVRPKAVVGHSSGEIAAAYTAGILSREGAWEAAYWRGVRSAAINRLLPDRPGCMMAVALSKEAAQEYLDRVEAGEVVVACINSPKSVTISGDETAIAAAEALFRADEVWCRKLAVQTAYHSPHTQVIAEQYLDDIKGIQTLEGASDVTMFSSVTGSEITAADLGPEYWVKNLTSPVQFSDAVTALLKPRDSRSRRKGNANVEALIEIGPHAALQGPLRDILAAASAAYASSVPYTSLLQRGTDATESAISAAGKLWAAGFNLDLALVNSTGTRPSAARPLVDLPRYPFNHSKRYWHDVRVLRWSQTHGHARSDLLGAPTRDFSTSRPSWKNYLSPAEVPWLVDHKIIGTLLLPGAVYIAMILEACQKTAKPGEVVQGYEFRDIKWHKGMVFETQDATFETLVQLSPFQIGTKDTTAPWTHWVVMTIDGKNESTTHCSGLVRIKYVTKPGEIEKGQEAKLEVEGYKRKYASIKASPVVPLQYETMYSKLYRAGLQFGPTFRNIYNMHAGEGYAFCDMVTPDTAAVMPEGRESPVIIHPVMLDAAFQMLTCTTRNAGTGPPLLPNSIGSLYISASLPTDVGSALKGYATRVPISSTKAIGNVILSDEAWEEPMVALKDMVLLAPPGAAVAPLKASYGRLDWFADIRQCPVSLPAIATPKQEVATVEDLDSTAAQLIKQTLTKLKEEEKISEPKEEEEKTSEAPVTEYSKWVHSVSAPEAAASEESSEFVASSTLDAVQLVGSSLEKILAEPSSASEVFTGEFMAKFLDTSLNRSWADSVALGVLDQAAYLNPDLAILEIGNGYTCSLATAVAERLGSKPSRITNYTLTARDEASLETAAKTLEARPFIESKVLDITQDLEAQEFKDASFDYVILDDMLASTPKLSAALLNIQKLLKPNGRLIVTAITQASLRNTFVLGALDTWWRDYDGADYSTIRLNADAWDELLKSNGFSGIDQSWKDAEDVKLQQLSVLMSSVTSEPPKPESNVILLHSATPSEAVSRLMANFSKILNARGLAAGTAEWSTVESYAQKIVVSFLEIDEPFLAAMTEELFHAVKDMALNGTSMLWITRGGMISGTLIPGFQVATGMFRSIRSENEDRRILTLDLSEKLDLVSEKAADVVKQCFDYMCQTGVQLSADCEFAEDHGVLHVQRLVEDQGLSVAENRAGSSPKPVDDLLFQKDRPLRMEIGQIGALDSLHYADNYKFMTEPLQPEYLEIKIISTALNFLDIMATLGEVPDPQLGYEAAGVVTAIGSAVTKYKVGDIVAGSLRYGFASHARIKQTIAQPVPAHLTIDEAASVPVVFETAWMSLVEEAKIVKGETILIHAGAGGLGQAAIQVCQLFGLEIFTTVSSNAKKALIMEQYGIPEDHIFYSRDLTFVQGIRRMTNGRGVDVVLNSLAGEFLRQSWHLVADFGRFVEVGKRDIITNTGLDMEPFLRSVNFIGFNLDIFRDHRDEFCEVEKCIGTIFKLLEEKKLRPVYPIITRPFSEITSAMRQLQSGKALGKFVLRAEDNTVVPVLPQIKYPLNLSPDVTYLLAGGLGGIGRSISMMLQNFGARNFAFLSKSGDSKPESREFLDQLKGLGCNANAYACSIADREQLALTLEKCSSEMPPIKGMIQCAMVLRDGMFENMTYDDWTTCNLPKIQGSWNLHELLPKDMDFFIMLASLTGVIGNPGQANYAAGNTFEDALALHRRRLGLAATALDLGAVRDVGYIAEMSESESQALRHLNKMMITENDIHFLVKTAITGHTDGDKEIPAQVISGLSWSSVDDDGDGSSWARMTFARDGKLSIALKAAVSKKSTRTEAGIATLLKAESVEAAVAIVEDMMIKGVASAVMMPEEDISPNEPLQYYGVNSLVAVEIRTWLVKEFQSEINVAEISPASISTLAVKLVKGSRLLRGKIKGLEDAA